MSYGDADRDLLLADMGESLTLGAASVLALIDESGEAMTPPDYMGQAVRGLITTAFLKTGSLPGLAPGASVTLRGATYEVRDCYPAPDDVGFTLALLAKDPAA